ncbi:MAG: hypothetical protein C0453_10305 [Comamonadaceae bacterium]|nr:hypothetical protein [Comamonadaceae bacterium]
MTLPRAAPAARHPLKGATPAARQSRFRGVSGRGHFARGGSFLRQLNSVAIYKAGVPCLVNGPEKGSIRNTS